MADPTTDAGNPPWDREPGTSPGAGKARACLIMAVLLLLVLVLLGLAARMWSDGVWRRHREQIRQDIRKVEPLLGALEMYRADSGAYPSTLSDLTPKYLPTIPLPPFHFVAQYGWEYSADPKEVNAWVDNDPANAGFEASEGIYHLYVTVPTEYSPLYGLFQDRLVYRPDERYPEVAYGGVLLERIDGWAYYHE